MKSKLQGLSLVQTFSQGLGRGLSNVFTESYAFENFEKEKYLAIYVSSPIPSLSAPSFMREVALEEPWELGNVIMKKLSLGHIYFEFNGVYSYDLQSLLFVVINTYCCFKAITP